MQAEFQADMLEPFVRFGVEEVLRRVAKNAEPLSKTAILNFLYPVWKVCRDETHLRLKKMMETSSTGESDGKYGAYVA